MVAGGILLSMSLITVMWLTGVSDMWWTTSTQSDVRTVSQQGVNRMVSELRSATRTAALSPPNAVIPAAQNNRRLVFFLPADLDLNGLIIDAIGNTEWNVGSEIIYEYIPAQQQVIRTQNGQQVVIASNVSDARFDDRNSVATLASNEIQITLTVQRTTPQRRTVTGTSVEIVKLRN
jgi:hypothetical protein